MPYVLKILFAVMFTIAFNSKQDNKGLPPRYWKMEEIDSLKIRSQLDSMIAVK